MAYLLSVEQVFSMSEYIEEQLNIANGCDHSRKHLMQWLNDNIEQEKILRALCPTDSKRETPAQVSINA